MQPPRLTRPCGLFNTLLSPCHPTPQNYSFRVIFWNARELFCADVGLLRRKVKFLGKLAEGG